MIGIENIGQELAWTNYWDVEHGRAGLFYMSGNAGAWRLLVPDAHHPALAEFATARFVDMELRCFAGKPCVVLWFEDGSDCPYRIVIQQQMLDRTIVPTTSRQPLLIYTRDGLAQRTIIRKVVKARH